MAKSATLESLRDKSKTVTSPAPVAADPMGNAEPFDWNALAPAEVAVYTRNVAAKDLEKDTPEVIKARVLAGFEATAKKGEAVYFVQGCGSEERAAEFLKLARRYATFREYTLRGAVNPKNLSEVRYTVKVKEKRPAKAK